MYGYHKPTAFGFPHLSGAIELLLQEMELDAAIRIVYPLLKIFSHKFLFSVWSLILKCC